jgi:hypothetical protein
MKQILEENFFFFFFFLFFLVLGIVANYNNLTVTECRDGMDMEDLTVANEKMFGLGVKQSILLAAGVATILTLGVTIGRLVWGRGSTEEISIFICDEQGIPITGAAIAIVGPSYTVIYPDERGRVTVDGSWKSIAVHDRRNWRLIAWQKLSPIGKELPVRIVIPNDILDGG